jgi:hypothetical protein
MVQVVWCLPSKTEALSSIRVPPKTKQNKVENRKLWLGSGFQDFRFA